jgi:ATP-binding cassette subfamily B protein
MSEQKINQKPAQHRRRGGPMGGFGMPVEKAKNFKGSLNRLVRYLKPHRINLIVVLIFAIASTIFTVYSPKVMSEAMNKLQDSYMSRNMLKNMSEGQKKIIDETYVNSIDLIVKQMSDVQKKMVTQIDQQMKQTQSPSLRPGEGSNPGAQQMDQEALKALQDFMKLPMIDTISDARQKNDTIIIMMDLLAKMPGTSQGSQQGQKIDPVDLGTTKDILELPSIDKITDPQKKNEAVVKFGALFDKMVSMQQNEQNSQLESSKSKIAPETMTALKEMLKLPMLDILKDADQKADVCQKFMDLSTKMQSSSQDGFQIPKAEKNVKYTPEQINGVIKAIRETNGEYDFKYIGRIALILIGMYLISSLFSLIMGLVMSGVAQKTVRDLRREVDNKLSRLPLKYYDMHPHGDILSRVTNDIDTIATTLQQSLTQIITAVVTILGYIIMMLTISPILTMIVLATLPLYILATTLIAKKSQKYFAAQQKELGALSGHVEEMYTGHKIVKAFGKEKDSIEKFEQINDKLYTSGWKAQFVSGIMFPLMNFISNLGYVMICIVGGIWITKNRLGLGDILAFIQYSRSFTMPIVQTANIANILQSTVACAERVFDVLDEQEEIQDRKDSKTIIHPNGEEDVPLINNMNLEVKKGHTIAIVGPTGAGKTTLVNLLMRFYEINAGMIKIDGVDVKDMKRSDLRKMFGMVLQDTWLFNGTIKDNIAYGKENATMDEIVRAAKAAHADHFIRTLPEGYNTVLNEEATNISQGQKQLLTIARAILADPTILILDEATSSVDTRTEVLIQKAMSNLMRDRTSFVIAHRLSTIRDAELILVMNHGSIIEMGNHKELLNKGGFYADLYNSQFAGADLESQAV